MCEIGYDGACGTEPSKCQCKPVQASNLLSLSQDMLTLLEDPEGGDVTLLLRGERIKAYKNILVARSTYFRNMFASGMSESQAEEIPLDEDPEAFKAALKFLYSGLAPDNLDEVAIRLLPVADKYMLDELKQVCDSAIRRILSIENVLDILVMTENHNFCELFEYCLPFFKANVNRLNKNDMNKLDKKLLVKLLRSE